jgi:hypothetical protein
VADAAVLKRPDDDASVRSLYLLGRKEDLAFEQRVGDSPRHRHHVRFGRTDKVEADGRSICWVGAANDGERVGLSRTIGEVTHVTAPDVDAERDCLFHDLEEVKYRAGLYRVVLSETCAIIVGFARPLAPVGGRGRPPPPATHQAGRTTPPDASVAVMVTVIGLPDSSAGCTTSSRCRSQLGQGSAPPGVSSARAAGHG